MATTTGITTDINLYLYNIKWTKKEIQPNLTFGDKIIIKGSKIGQELIEFIILSSNEEGIKFKI